MLLEIRPNSSKPIYEQLILEIKKGIVTNELRPGESMPSVRALAADLGVNMHTVNKVYKHLQNENILVKEKSGFAVNPKRSSQATPAQEVEFQEKLFEVIVEKELHQLSDERFAEVIAAIQKRLRKEV